jgi:amino acid transporter
VPFGILLSVAIAAAVYILVNLAYCAVLTVPQILSGITIAAVSSQTHNYENQPTKHHRIE